MGDVISQIIAEWGATGLILLGLAYILWDNWKTNKAKKSEKDTVIVAVNNMSGKIDNLHDKIKIVDYKVEEFKSQIDTKMDLMEQKMDEVPHKHMQQQEIVNATKQKAHLKQLDDLMKLGPKLHRIIQTANNNIGSDHIFVGSFHNGNSSLSGIPYYKFDIIAERFSPTKVLEDCEFAHMYKDSDILRYDMLPSLLVQQGLIHFSIPEDGVIGMADYDDIIWRRMIGRGIKQIAVRLTRDSKGSPSGFVGVVKYDYSNLKLEHLESCGRDLEEIYREAELKEINNI